MVWTDETGKGVDEPATFSVGDVPDRLTPCTV
jgi:hypothetical protein